MGSNRSIQDFSRDYTSSLSPVLQNVIRIASEELNYTDMFSSQVELGVLRHILITSNCKNVLELGMFCGLSAMAFAEVLPKEGKVITIEPNARYIDIAERAWQGSPHRTKIEILNKRADEALPVLLNQNPLFDFIFIDADKENYPVYYDVLLPFLSKNGTMAIDNMYWHGKVNSKEDKKGKVIAELNEQIKKDTRVESVFLPIRDGLVLLRKV